MDMILQSNKSITKNHPDTQLSPLKPRFSKRFYLPDSSTHQAWIKSHLGPNGVAPLGSVPTSDFSH